MKTTVGEQRKGAALRGDTQPLTPLAQLPDSAVIYLCGWQAYATAGPGTPPPPSGALGEGSGTVFVDEQGREYPDAVRQGG
jgi:hypothetical protein